MKKAILSYLDKNVSHTEEGLNKLVSQCDELVWNIATYVYRQSGHQVDFSLIRDIINSRIEPLKQHIAYKNSEKARRLAKQERIKQDIEAKIKQEEQEAKRLAEVAYVTEVKRQLKEFGKEESALEIFLQIRDIVSEVLDLELGSKLYNR